MYNSPGYKLREFLMKIIPNSVSNQGVDERHPISKIDYILFADDSFADTIYQSSINYLLRRLILSADYISREFEYSEELFVYNLRKFLKNDFKFTRSDVEKILSLLLEIRIVINTPLRTPTRNAVKKQAASEGALTCYICGRGLSLETEDGTPDSIEIEHMWPHSLGGSNELENLKVACGRCNKQKESTIDASDYHFEHINSVKLKGLNIVDRMAVWAKNNYKCSKCNREAVYVGPLKISRLNRDDSWHFLNLESYCQQHFSEDLA